MTMTANIPTQQLWDVDYSKRAAFRPGAGAPRNGAAPALRSPDCECIAKWQKPLPPLSPEEAEERMHDFRIALDVRMRRARPSLRRQLAEAIRKELAADARQCRRRTSDMPAPVVEETQLAPETAGADRPGLERYVRHCRRSRTGRASRGRGLRSCRMSMRAQLSPSSRRTPGPSNPWRS